MIYRSKKTKWTTVDNAWVKDPTLSAKAKGILLYILSLPDDWDLRIKELVTHFTEGIDSIRSGMKELSMHLYIDSNQRRDVTGKVIGWDYTIYENPQTDYPDMENPDMENPTLLNTKEILSTKKNIVATESQRRIVAHLNKRLGKKPGKGYMVTNQEMLKALNARLKQYTEADITAVIDLKADEWLGTEMQRYIRPITLFNVNKFESYINEIDVEGAEARNHGVMPLQDFQ